MSRMMHVLRLQLSRRMLGRASTRLARMVGLCAAWVLPLGLGLSGAAQAASFEGLGDLPGGTFDSFAFAASADGSVVVGHSQSVPASDEAFRWTSGGGMVGLGDLPGGGFSSIAAGVSADGTVVVGNGDSASGGEAFRWTSGGGMVGLGDLAGGSFSSTAAGVSADGAVVVGFSRSTSGFEAYRWTSGGGMVGLGDLAGGLFNSQARGVSADGSVVVGDGVSVSGFEAFIWDSSNGMRSLQDVLTTDFGLGSELTGWTLDSARGISDDGLTIVGSGTNPSGFREAWRAQLGAEPVPTLSQWGVFLLAILLLGLGLRRGSGRAWGLPRSFAGSRTH